MNAFDAIAKNAPDKKDGSLHLKNDEKARKIKKEKELKAKERKSKRDKEAERIKSENEAVAELKEDKKKRELASAPVSDRERLILDYFDNPVKGVFYGTNDFVDKDEVRTLCGGPDNLNKERFFDWDAKLWGTRRIHNIPALVKLDHYGDPLWWPVGICKSWRGEFLSILHRKIHELSEDAEAKNAREREASMQNAEPVMNAQEKQALQEIRNREAGILDATDAERDAIASLGIRPDVVLRSKVWKSLGETPAVSLEGRMLIFIDIVRGDARSCLEQTPSEYFDPKCYEPLEDRAVESLVRQWNAEDNWEYRFDRFEESYL
jgi:hypothetical protein